MSTPEGTSLTLRRDERILLLGDSITEARMHSCLLESYLAMCRPDLRAEVRNLGKGGETASEFLLRMEGDAMPWSPTLAVVSYGMNDSGYSGRNGATAASSYGRSIRTMVRRLRQAGSRIVLCSPGCIGRLPPWPFLAERNETLDGLNETLRLIRNETARIALEEGLPFVDHFEALLRAKTEGIRRHGEGYAACGAEDGVHPSWAGHAVMAFGILKALGLEGIAADLRIDLTRRTATASAGHRFLAHADGDFRFRSVRYPFCADGPLDRDDSIRSGLALVPFQGTFNRWRLTVTGADVPRFRVAWTRDGTGGGEPLAFDAKRLEEGIDLVDLFPENPFLERFLRVGTVVRRKQDLEVEETWLEREKDGSAPAAGMAVREADRDARKEEIRRMVRPIAHGIRIEAMP